MMCLLSTTVATSSATGGAGPFIDAYNAVDSPESTTSSNSSKTETPSPPQLSPQIMTRKPDLEQPIFVDLPTAKENSNDVRENFVSPQMALLTPQIKTSDASAVEEEDEVLKIVVTETVQVRKKVPFTFCNMRQNIFDLKKKRGRKNSKEWRKNNISLDKRRLTTSSTSSSSSSDDQDHVQEPNLLMVIEEDYFDSLDIDDAKENNLPLDDVSAILSNKSNLLGQVKTSAVIKHQKPCPLRKRKFLRTESLDDDHGSSKMIKNVSDAHSESHGKQIRRMSANARLTPDHFNNHQKTEVLVSNNDFEDEIVTNQEPPIVCVDVDDDYVDESDIDLHLHIDDDDDDDDDVLLSTETDLDPLAIVVDDHEPLFSSQELVEVVVDNLVKSIVANNLNGLTVPIVDIFEATPLSSFCCCGCSNSYSIKDAFSVNLKRQTMRITCSHCSWWTHRRVGVASKPYLKN
jgi:hypothetical protein